MFRQLTTCSGGGLIQDPGFMDGMVKQSRESKLGPFGSSGFKTGAGQRPLCQI